MSNPTEQTKEPLFRPHKWSEADKRLVRNFYLGMLSLVVIVVAATLIYAQFNPIAAPTAEEIAAIKQERANKEAAQRLIDAANEREVERRVMLANLSPGQIISIKSGAPICLSESELDAVTGGAPAACKLLPGDGAAYFMRRSKGASDKIWVRVGDQADYADAVTLAAYIEPASAPAMP